MNHSMLAAGLLIPFVGTASGAAMVLFMKKDFSEGVRKALLGFASGVMVAASVWSLLMPAMEMGEGKRAVIPAAAGLAIGFAFLLLLDQIIPHLHAHADAPEGRRSSLTRSMMLVLAVTLHNLPEGMAVGVVFAGALASAGSGAGVLVGAGSGAGIGAGAGVSWAAAMSLAIGIAIQNFPEGAIVSMPLKESGLSKSKAFLYGTLSGAVEPVGALLMIALTSLMTPVLPYLLAFAAGAMLYVVVEELIPEASVGRHSNTPAMSFAGGFILMMVLDVVLG